MSKKVVNALTNFTLYMIDLWITGFVTCYLWNNIAAVLFDLRTLTFWQGWAFCSLVKWFMPMPKKKKDIGDWLAEDILHTLAYWALSALIVVFMKC